MPNGMALIKISNVRTTSAVWSASVHFAVQNRKGLDGPQGLQSSQGSKTANAPKARLTAGVSPSGGALLLTGSF